MKKVYTAICSMLILTLACATSSAAPTDASVRDLTIVSTSPEGNHVNTVAPLNKGEWVVMALTGGKYLPTGEVLGPENKCVFTMIEGLTTNEYSIEATDDNYFLAYFDSTQFETGTKPEAVINYLYALYSDPQYEFCSAGIELFLIVEIAIEVEVLD